MDRESVKYYTDEGHLLLFNKYETDGINVYYKKNDRECKIETNEDGYNYVRLFTDDNERKKCYLHRLLCTVYYGVPDEINFSPDHINRNREDNRLENLRWIDIKTQQTNKKKRNNINNCIPILYTDDKNITVKFKSITEASIKCGFSIQNIQRWCSGTRKCSYNCFWNYDKTPPDIPGEKWVQTDDNNLLISNLGRIQRKFNDFYSSKKFAREYTGPDNYPRIYINSKPMRIHILVALTFIQNPEKKPYVLHKNLDKKDASVENLEWSTQREIMLHHKNNLNKTL